MIKKNIICFGLKMAIAVIAAISLPANAEVFLANAPVKEGLSFQGSQETFATATLGSSFYLGNKADTHSVPDSDIMDWTQPFINNTKRIRLATEAQTTLKTDAKVTNMFATWPQTSSKETDYSTGILSAAAGLIGSVTHYMGTRLAGAADSIKALSTPADTLSSVTHYMKVKQLAEVGSKGAADATKTLVTPAFLSSVTHYMKMKQLAEVSGRKAADSIKDLPTATNLVSSVTHYMKLAGADSKESSFKLAYSSLDNAQF